MFDISKSRDLSIKIKKSIENQRNKLLNFSQNKVN